MKSFFLTLAFLCSGYASLSAGYAPYTERGTVDFDVFYLGTKPHGKWSSDATYRYIFIPEASAQNSWRPYREGKWTYTDNGWTWKGSRPWDWATDHYGFWSKRSLASWAWIPGDNWLPASVEWIQSGNYVGWRACELDRFSNMVESDEERYKDPSEWNFVLKSKLTEALKPSDFASDAESAELLKKMSPADHIYVSYREIPRPGLAPKVIDETTKAKIPVPSLMNLASVDGTIPPDTATEVYVFRPKFYQDMDGVFKRIEALNKGNNNLQVEKVSVAQTLTPKPTATETAEASSSTDATRRKELRRLQAEQKHIDSLYK